MGILETLIAAKKYKSGQNETLIKEVIFIADCGQENPVQRFSMPTGYVFGDGKPISCRNCSSQATFKTLFLSPSRVIEGFFGPVYHCSNHVPDINSIGNNGDTYYDLIYNIKK